MVSQAFFYFRMNPVLSVVSGNYRHGGTCAVFLRKEKKVNWQMLTMHLYPLSCMLAEPKTSTSYCSLSAEELICNGHCSITVLLHLGVSCNLLVPRPWDLDLPKRAKLHPVLQTQLD